MSLGVGHGLARAVNILRKLEKGMPVVFRMVEGSLHALSLLLSRHSPIFLQLLILFGFSLEGLWEAYADVDKSKSHQVSLTSSFANYFVSNKHY